MNAYEDVNEEKPETFYRQKFFAPTEVKKESKSISTVKIVQKKRTKA